jgi:hypothetical protein
MPRSFSGITATGKQFTTFVCQCILKTWRWLKSAIVTDGSAKLAYIYYEDEPGRRPAAKLLTKDDARRIAANNRQAAGLIKSKRLDWFQFLNV